jgi:hypothetical protein
MKTSFRRLISRDEGIEAFRSLILSRLYVGSVWRLLRKKLIAFVEAIQYAHDHRPS